MIKEKPLWLRLYHEVELYETARVVGYDGFAVAEREAKIATLVERFGRGRVESALFTLTNWMPHRPEPTVKLREHVIKLCWQLLGPPPGHPEWNAYHSDQPFVPPWNRLPDNPKPEPKPKRTRKKS